MPRISQKTKDKISEQILHHLFSFAPQPQYTASIASSLARDEEFIKFLLLELEKKQFVIKVTKSQQGTQYTRRARWRLSNSVFEAYKKMADKTQNNNFHSSNLT